VAKTSYYGRVIDIDDNTFSQTRAVHAGEAFLLRNNIAHAIDISTQVRINWTSQVGALYGVHYVSFNGAFPNRYMEEFPITWLAPDKPANLRVEAAFKHNTSDNSDYDWRISIVPANTPPGQGASLAILDQSGTETDNLPTFFAGNVVGADFVPQLRTAWQTVGLTNDGDAFRHVQLCMLRLEIELSGSPESQSDVMSVYVAEYA
jgi:hypothetical protein